jgi:ribosomal protein S18 acetylase RimI-like enzyme
MGSFILDTGEEIEIAEALVCDAEGILGHAHSILIGDDFNVSSIDELDITLEQERDWIQGHIDNAGQVIFVAKSAGEVVGLLTVYNRQQKRVRHVGIVHLSVNLSWRRRGIATVLMEEVIGWAEVNPVIEKLGLAVFADNTAAIGLYEKMGFVEEGRRIKEVKRSEGSYVDDILMYRLVKNI